MILFIAIDICHVDRRVAERLEYFAAVRKFVGSNPTRGKTLTVHLADGERRA